MTVEAVNQFLQKVTEDQKLEEELAKILETKDNDQAAVTQLGAKYGCEFTSDELWQEIEHRQSEFQLFEAAGELSEEDLEAVSGGTTPITIPIRTATMATRTAKAGIHAAHHHHDKRHKK